MESRKVLVAMMLLVIIGTTIAVDEGTKGRGRGAGLAERMRQRKQRREDERNAQIQDRRVKMRQQSQGDGLEGQKMVGRINQNVAQKISAPLKKRLEEMRNRRRESADEL